ncbi:hypothetical protein J6590_088779 [Homalodisca vitripennis]|nr:hypothetical protein J6590_088779 [Homalodisca vitripennis]
MPVTSCSNLLGAGYSTGFPIGAAPRTFIKEEILTWQSMWLICSEGKRWREQRSFVTSTLKTLGMVKYGPRRDRLEARILQGVVDVVEYLKTQDGREVDASRTLLHSVGNVVNSLVFGRRWDWDDPTWRWLQHLSDEGVKHIGVSGPLNFLPFLRFLPKYRRTVHFIVDGMRKTHEVYQQVIDDHPEDKVDDFIAAFQKEQRERGTDLSSFTQKQFHHALADLFGAGVDTTLTTLRWFLIYVAKHQDVQKRIQEDLDVICWGAPRLEQVSKMYYLQAAIAESQRIRPVVPVGIPHGASQETMVAGYRIPRGTMVIPLQWAVHMDPQHWPDPDRYDPERFLDGEGKFFKPEAFIPFQTGKRMCMGEELARMILLLYTSNLLYFFRVTLPPSCQNPLESHCGITLVPTLRTLHFHKRTGAVDHPRVPDQE